MGLTYQFPREKIVEAVHKRLAQHVKGVAVCAAFTEMSNAIAAGAKKLTALGVETPELNDLIDLLSAHTMLAAHSNAMAFRLQKIVDHLSPDPVVTIDHKTAITLGLFDQPEEDKE